ncbi:conjugative transfer system coupling protein TraD [Acidihalobacter ferrooxydans]|uniref:Conjugal transfer protein n=1 Tax=Acidihalobacter ferrooxydans TaxID=1765967 RepID=A0A1P8UFL5_9GAMM|nr:conjugative transfer system coupling protein TraD [Acidihalobacter ferrooxydans]APZ42635.1 hypothetical protein BW247_05590 [Acidihalobacter ferrooxydans]
MKHNANFYEPPFRPPYEQQAAWGWAIASATTLATTFAFHLPLVAGVSATAVAGTIGAWRWYQGEPYALNRKRLMQADKLWFISRDKANQWYQWASAQNKLWLGRGYEVTPQAAEKIRIITSRGLNEALGQAPGQDSPMGWIQQIEPAKPIVVDFGDLDGHVIIVGSTGRGKTRCFDHIIGQAIARGEPVIALDPKGDSDLEETMRDAYRRAGRPEAFAAFRPARPENSVRIDPLANWGRATEVVSRIIAQVEADGSFKAFVWRVMNNIVQGEIAAGRKPNLLSLRRLVERGIDGLLLEVLKTYCTENAKPEEYLGYVNNAMTKNGREVDGYVEFYERVLVRRAPSLSVEGLIADYRHDKEHFSKMVVSLTPILSMLTTPPLDELLSPQPRAGDNREIITIDKVVKQGRGLYVSLASLSDPTVGSAIGSILLSDAAALAGERLESAITEPRVTLLGDEIAEITNDQLTQILNKGRGAGIRAVIATQTLADLEVRLGSRAKALQQVGNLNNIIVFSLKDPDTAKQIASSFPKYQARQINRSYSQSIQAHPGDTWGGGYGESLQQQDVDLLPADLLMRLPKLHYVAQFSDGRVVKGQIPIVGNPK